MCGKSKVQSPRSTTVNRIDIGLWTLDIGLLMQTVTVAKRGADRLRQGHLWIYRSDVLDTANAPGGSIVAVKDQKGNFVGQALFSDASEITLRLLTQTAEVVDREWWRRLQSAASRRSGISADTNAYRLVTPKAISFLP